MSNILTEEELKGIELSLSRIGGDMIRLVASHHELLSANAELSFKNQKYKKALDELKRNVHPEGWLKTIVDEALEELK